MGQVARITRDLEARGAYGVVYPTSLEDLGASIWPDEEQFQEEVEAQWTYQWVRRTFSEIETCSGVTVLSFPEGEEEKEEYIPRTPLGKRLLEIRKRAIQAGMKLLSVDEILEEVRRRRGELKEDEEDLY